jgi:hypothetical protein
MRFRFLFFTFLLFIGVACQTAAPTPILIERLTNLNNEVVQLYVDCSEGANYVPTKEGCNSELLSVKVDELMLLSVDFIRADIKQPQGYDIHLATAMIYFRIGQRNLNDYTKAEQIARQFFEIQKAHSGHSIDTARFYWAWFAAATASKQYFEDPLSLSPDRKADLLLAAGEGTTLLNKLEGSRLVRLQQALITLKFVIDSIG